MRVPEPIVEITYNGKNISKDVSPYLISFTYNDKTEGASDEITLEFEDSELLWINGWYPSKKDKIKARIGYNGSWLDCGTFEVDDIEFDGPPDVLKIRALGAGVSTSTRTKNSRSFENLTLKQVVDKVAQANGLTVEGTIPDVKFKNLRQYRQHDLTFLRKVAHDYGCVFSVRDKKITFSQIWDIEQVGAIVAIDRTEISRYSLRDKSEGTYKAAQVKYHDPVKNKVVQHNQNVGADNNYFKDIPLSNDVYDKVYAENNFSPLSVGMQETASSDTLEIRAKAETEQQAEAQSKAALYRANTKTIEGRISMPGNTKIIAGNNFNLTGMGKLSMKYHIKESVHTVNRSSGYSTDADIKAISSLPKSKHSPVKTKPKKQPTVGGGFGRPYYNDPKFV